MSQLGSRQILPLTTAIVVGLVMLPKLLATADEIIKWDCQARTERLL